MVLRKTFGILMCCICLPSGGLLADVGKTKEEYAALGRAAAKAGFEGYASLCDLERPIRNVNVKRERKPRPSGKNAQRRPTNRYEFKPIPATQVFDNLWFLGTPSVTTWLYGTPEGYLLIDGLGTDEDAQKHVLGAMQDAGLDPSAIEAILVTHGHGDHYGGADYLSKTLNVPILMTQADWALVGGLGVHPRFGPAPERDKTVEDGQILEFGSSSLQVHVTPGHTPGTVSPIFTVHDGEDTHSALLWGGTGFNFGPFIEVFEDYAASARKMRRHAQRADVEVFISGHPGRDGTVNRLKELRSRAPGEPHPFVRQHEGELFDVLENCALAQAERFRASGHNR